MKLTEEQEELKFVFCMVMTAFCAVVCVWGVLWELSALRDGVLSVTHLIAALGGALMARTFWHITNRM